MFTGIVRGRGRLEARETHDRDQRLVVDTGNVLPACALEAGSSVAVNGVCLTVAERTASGFAADVSPETLAKTTLGVLPRGSALNLEPALAAGEALGGHLVSGHVDGVGEIAERVPDARAWRFRIVAPAPLSPLIAPKGSIAVDGVSLTVNAVEGDTFEVAIIPATMQRTLFEGYQSGVRVNLEADLIARYVERLLAARGV